MTEIDGRRVNREVNKNWNLPRVRAKGKHSELYFFGVTGPNDCCLPLSRPVLKMPLDHIF